MQPKGGETQQDKRKDDIDLTRPLARITYPLIYGVLRMEYPCLAQTAEELYNRWLLKPFPMNEQTMRATLRRYI